MTVSRRENQLTRTLGMALGSLLLALTMVPTVATAGQASTPAPAGTPAASLSCGERHGIGDASVGCLTLIHASSDAGPVDISIDGAVLFSGVTVGTSTGFVALPDGTYDVRVTATSQPDAVLLEAPEQRLTAGQGLELAIVGSRDASTLSSLALPVDPAAAQSGTATLRIVQAIPDAPPLDVALPSGETVVTALAPLTASAYLTVPAAAASVDIRASGSPEVLFPIPQFAAPDGATMTVYAIGSVTNPTGIVLLTVIVPGNATQVPADLTVATPAA